MIDIVEIEKLAEPADHQAIKAFAPQINLSFNAWLHLPQVGNDMEKSLSGVLKESLEVFAVNGKTYVSGVIQNLIAFHRGWFGPEPKEERGFGE